MGTSTIERKFGRTAALLLAATAAALVGSFAMPLAAMAQDICGDINNGDLNSFAVPANATSTRVVDDVATGTEVVLFIWSGMGDVEVEVNNVLVIDSNAASGNQSINLPAGLSVGIIRRVTAGGGTGQIDVTCTQGGFVDPHDPLAPGPVDETLNVVVSALDDQRVRHLPRSTNFFAEGFSDLFDRPSLTYEDAAERLAEKQEMYPELSFEIVQFGTEEAYRIISTDPAEESAAQQFFPSQSRIDPSVQAISRFFDYGNDTFSGSAPLQSSVPGWEFRLNVDSAVIDRSFAALQRRTWVGTVNLQGKHRLDGRTLLGTGIIIGGASTTFNTPAAMVNTTNLGADVAILHMLSPTLAAGLYGSYELGLHQATITGVNSSFRSHTIALGGTLRGVMTLGDYQLTPSLDALVSNRFVPGFTDGAGVAIAGFNTLDIDASAGVTLSRDFIDGERNLILTPYVTANLVFDASSGGAIVAQPIPGDPVRGELAGGLRVTWVEGAKVNVEASVSRGANTTVFGLDGGLSIPIN